MGNRGGYVLGIILLALLLSASTPLTLDTRIAEYHVQITFLDGPPHAEEPTRIAVSVLEPTTRAIPDEQVVVAITGGTSRYQIGLDRAPTTIVSLPGLPEGTYELRVQIYGSGVTEALELRVGRRPLFEANPLLGGIFIVLGLGLLIVILFSDRFKK